MKVLIPTLLRAYTGAREVEAGAQRWRLCWPISTAAIPACASASSTSRAGCGDTSASSRRAARIFELSHAFAADDTLVIVQALSGG